MKRFAFAALVAFHLCLAISRGQAPTPPLRPPLPPPILSPEIAADRHVTFRLQAATAKEISVSGQWDKDARTPLTRGEGGIWGATLGPLPAGVYEYNFTVDGLAMVDPGNTAIKPQRQVRASILHIPAVPPATWDLQNVPHGTLHQHTYLAASLGRPRELVVYTPPGYERDTAAKFPLLVLIHGFGDNQAAWSQHGKAHWILDNLIAEKKAAPMIVVMPDGHPVPVAAGPREEYSTKNTEAFERDLLEEVLPLVEANYRVRSEVTSRAIAGLSMGGGHALNCGLRHADRFAWIGAFSAGVPADRLSAAMGNPEQLNEHLKLLWIAVGKDDHAVPRNEQLVADLAAKSIRHTWQLTEGDHTWPVWRRYFAEFAPLLFR